MVACQSWGLQTRYIGRVGDDYAAELHRKEFARAGVETHLISVPGCPSQAAYILIDGSSGERTILWRRDPRLAIRPEDLQRDLITSARALHVDAHDTEAAAAAAQWARGASLPVTADVDTIYPGIEVLLENVDYVIASQSFPSRFTSEGDLEKALPFISVRFGNRATVATLGRDGALAWSPAERRFFYSPAFQVEVRDTTGAGDIFHGAFVYAMLQNWPMPRILDFCCAAAALNCTAVGARAGIRPLGEIERLIREGRRRPPQTALVKYISGRNLE